MNYIVSGEEALVNEKKEDIPVKQGDFVLVLPDEKHQYKNTSETQSLVFICGVPKDFE